jgi:hypothetical protein
MTGTPAFALGPVGVSALSSVNLLVAGLDLSLVRLLRGAMHAADVAAGGACCGGAGERCRDVFTPTPRFEPRVVYHPTPRYEPRPVIHPEPRVEWKGYCAGLPPPCFPPVPAPECPGEPEWPVKAVWKTLPELPPPGPQPQIKVQVVRPDIRHKGTLIDTFI